MSDITLGITGSGQLGSLLCQAAKKINVKTVVISDDEQGPAQNYSNEFIFSKYDDENKIKEFINKVDIVTFEFENIPVGILKKIELKKKVLPKPDHEISSENETFVAFWAMSDKTFTEVEVLLYPFTSLIAEFGGALGLFFGFSFMTIWQEVRGCCCK